MKRPTFTLRDLFWLVLVAGMGCAWWVDRSRATHENRWIIKELNRMGAEIGHANSGERAIVWPDNGTLRQMRRVGS